MTLEEFAEYAERFCREHKESGTLSLRHLQHLVTGRRGDGRPLRLAVDDDRQQNATPTTSRVV